MEGCGIGRGIIDTFYKELALLEHSKGRKSSQSAWSRDLAQEHVEVALSSNMSRLPAKEKMRMDMNTYQ